MSGDLARRPSRDVDAYLMRQSEGAGVAARRLLQRSVATEKVVAECWEEFRRRSPQEAQAISSDPRSAPRLTAALAQAPLPGYRQLFQLIAERRASAKGLARAHRNTNESSTSSTTKVPRRHGSHA